MQMSTGKTRKGTKYQRSTKKTAKKSLFKSKFPARSTAVASRSVGLGCSTRTILRTSFFANVTAQANGIFNGYLKPGSAFDPTGDFAAIQPQMYDQFSAVYNRYKVNSATIRIKITGLKGGASDGGVWVAAAYPSVDPAALTTYQAAASQQYAKTTSSTFYLNQGAQNAYTAAGAEGKYLSFKLSHDAIVGAKSDTWDIGGPVASDPVAGQFMVLPMFLQSSTGAGNNQPTWVLEIDIWQDVTFSQKKNTVDA